MLLLLLLLLFVFVVRHIVLICLLDCLLASLLASAGADTERTNHNAKRTTIATLHPPCSTGQCNCIHCWIDSVSALSLCALPTHTHTHTARETDRSILRVRGAPTKGAQTQNTSRSHQSLGNKENELTETKRNNPGDCSVVAQIAHKLIHIHSVSLLLSFSLSLLLLLQYTVSQCFLKIG